MGLALDEGPKVRAYAVPCNVQVPLRSHIPTTVYRRYFEHTAPSIRGSVHTVTFGTLSHLWGQVGISSTTLRRYRFHQTITAAPGSHLLAGVKPVTSDMAVVE